MYTKNHFLWRSTYIVNIFCLIRNWHPSDPVPMWPVHMLPSSCHPLPLWVWFTARMIPFPCDLLDDNIDARLHWQQYWNKNKKIHSPSARLLQMKIHSAFAYFVEVPFKTDVMWPATSSSTDCPRRDTSGNACGAAQQRLSGEAVFLARNRVVTGVKSVVMMLYWWSKDLPQDYSISELHISQHSMYAQRQTED